ncbi:MAG: hypothetical protein R3F34_09845 [Planctomycetota bacterium]
MLGTERCSVAALAQSAMDRPSSTKGSGSSSFSDAVAPVSSRKVSSAPDRDAGAESQRGGVRQRDAEVRAEVDLLVAQHGLARRADVAEAVLALRVGGVEVEVDRVGELGLERDPVALGGEEHGVGHAPAQTDVRDDHGVVLEAREREQSQRQFEVLVGAVRETERPAHRRAAGDADVGFAGEHRSKPPK